MLTHEQITKITTDNIRKRQDNDGNKLENGEVRFWVEYHAQNVNDRKAFLVSAPKQLLKRALNWGMDKFKLIPISDDVLNAAVDREEQLRAIQQEEQLRAALQQSTVSTVQPHSVYDILTDEMVSVRKGQSAANDMLQAQQQFFKDRELDSTNPLHYGWFLESLGSDDHSERSGHVDGHSHHSIVDDRKYDSDSDNDEKSQLNHRNPLTTSLSLSVTSGRGSSYASAHAQHQSTPVGKRNKEGEIVVHPNGKSISTQR